MNTFPVIAIDGPSGSGKGTVASAVADVLGWHLLDSGALYRIVAYSAIQNRLNLDEPEKLSEMIQGLDIAFVRSNSDLEILVDGEEVTRSIRTDAVSVAASTVAQHETVRVSLVALQRKHRQPPGLVADGRDMGSVVFVDAPLKIYLDASLEARALRRYKQLKDKDLDDTLRDLSVTKSGAKIRDPDVKGRQSLQVGVVGGLNLQKIRDSMANRDVQDKNRKSAPLVKADDAIYIDSTDLSVENVINEIIRHARSRSLTTC